MLVPGVKFGEGAVDFSTCLHKLSSCWNSALKCSPKARASKSWSPALYHEEVLAKLELSEN